MSAKIKSGRIESQRESADCADYKKDKVTQQKGSELQNEIAERVVPVTSIGRSSSFLST
jgi:hypothetical protein